MAYDIRESIFNLMKSFGYTMKMYDSDGNGPILKATDSEYIYATKGSQNYMFVVEDDDTTQYNSIILYRSNIEDKKEFRDILKMFKNIAIKNAFSISIKNFGRNFTPKDFSNMPKKKADVSESFAIDGTKKTSYHTKESAKVIVKHKKLVDEDVRYARSKNIKEVYVATKSGERRKVSENSLLVGKAVANYVNFGGKIFDNVVDTIVELGNDLNNLKRLRLNETEMDDERYSIIREKAGDGRKQINRFIGAISKRSKSIDPSIFECFSGPEFEFTKAYYECVVSDSKLAESLARASILSEMF